MSQEQDGFNDEELTMMALEIMEDLDCASIKPCLDSADSYQFKLDSFQLVENDIYSSLSTIASKQFSMTPTATSYPKPSYTDSYISPQYEDEYKQQNNQMATKKNSYNDKNNLFLQPYKTFSSSSHNQNPNHAASHTGQ